MERLRICLRLGALRNDIYLSELSGGICTERNELPLGHTSSVVCSFIKSYHSTAFSSGWTRTRICQQRGLVRVGIGRGERENRPGLLSRLVCVWRRFGGLGNFCSGRRGLRGVIVGLVGDGGRNCGSNRESSRISRKYGRIGSRAQAAEN